MNPSPIKPPELAPEYWLPVFAHETGVPYTSGRNCHLAARLSKIGEGTASAMIRVAVGELCSGSEDEIEVIVETLMSDKQLVGWVDSCGLVGKVICEPIVRSTFLDNPELCRRLFFSYVGALVLQSRGDFTPVYVWLSIFCRSSMEARRFTPPPLSSVQSDSSSISSAYHSEPLQDYSDHQPPETSQADDIQSPRQRYIDRNDHSMSVHSSGSLPDLSFQPSSPRPSSNHSASTSPPPRQRARRRPSAHRTLLDAPRFDTSNTRMLGGSIWTSPNVQIAMFEDQTMFPLPGYQTSPTNALRTAPQISEYSAIAGANDDRLP